jgi:hypothetical protein
VTDRPPDGLGVTDRFTREAMTDRHLDWLRGLPPMQIQPGVLAVHGIPGDDNRYLLERVSAFRLVPDAPAAISARLSASPAGEAPALVLCGHSHRPCLMHLPDGPTVLNPGSVGCPAYQDPVDDPHVSEAGSPHARYAVVSLSDRAVSADLIAVHYDHRAAAARAEALGRSDWAQALGTGYAPPLPGMT